MKVTWQQMLAACAVVLTAMVVVAFLAWALTQGDSSEQRHAADGVRAANLACAPARPHHLEYHGAGWSNEPYWTITCADGSQQIVRWDGR